MSDLLKIVKESMIRFGGSLLACGLSYVLLMVITRFLTPSEYGTFVLAQSITSLSLLFVLVGTPKTLERFIPFYNAAGEIGKAKTLVNRVLRNAVLVSLIVASGLFLLSGPASRTIFKDPALAPVLRIMVLAVPTLATIELVSAVFAGFKELRYAVYVQQLAVPTLRIALAIAAFLAGYRLLGWTWMYVASLAAGAALALWFFRKHVTRRLSGIPGTRVSLREILCFSWPLSIQGVVVICVGQVGFLFLGYFRPTAELGTFRIYVALAALLSLVLHSVAQIHKPVISGLISTGRIHEVRETYRRVTKWIFLANALGLLVLVLFGARIASLLFTERYLGTPFVLLILAVGHFVTSSFGPRGTTLEAFGNTRLVMINSLIWLGSCVGLCAVLVPRYGITGAAVASAASATLGGLAGLIEVYVFHGIQPFDMRYARIVSVTLATGCVAYVLDSLLRGAGAGALLGLVLLTAVVYVLGLHTSRCLDSVDREVFDRIRARITATGKME